ncbi:MAG: TonB-dependent receptor [Bacteroidales bacterium]|nr:TonB-dependent receptor [Bacteroidales bacterium]
MQYSKFDFKHIVLFFIVFFTISQSSLFAQNDSIKINVAYKNTPLKIIIEDISSQTGFSFVYNNDIVNDQIKLDIKIKNKNLYSVLKQLTQSIDLDYIILEKQIILKPHKNLILNSNNEDSQHRILSISGYVKDSTTNEILIGATITVLNQTIGTLSDGYGHYNLSLKKGEYTIVYSYLGYEKEYVTLNLNSNIIIDKSLKQINTQLEAISVTGDKVTNNIKETLQKSSSLNVSDFNKYSGLIIGGDIVGILSTDHGITRQSDGSAFYNVRGGYKDQNLILIDEAPIYHPSHLFGFFSAVAPDAINSLNVYTSDFPIKYGGRLSSITDIRTKDGSSGNLILSGDFTPFTNSYRFETPIIKDKITATANYRRSNIKWVANQLDNDGDNHFYDVHAKIQVKTSQKNRLYFSYFRGSDYYSNIQTVNNYAVEWQNNAATIRNYRILSPKLTVNNHAYVGQYKYKLYTSETKESFWTTKIANLSFKSDFVYNISTNHTARFGVEYSFHAFEPAAQYINNIKSNKGIVSGNADNIVAYLGAESVINKKIAVKYGVRLSIWNNYGPAKYFNYNDKKMVWDTINISGNRFNTFVNYEPRLALVYKPIPKMSIKISAERNIQYLHLLSNSISPFTTLDLWIPSSLYFKPQVSRNITLTLMYNMRQLSITCCAYYKYANNITEYGSHANMLLNESIERDFYLGMADAKGFEFAIEKSAGSARFKCFYAYSNSQRLTPKLSKNKYISSDNIPHNLHLMGQYSFNNRFIIKADWNFSSGIPYTEPIGFYYYQDYKIPFYGERNNSRLRLYHKLNIASVYTFKNNKLKFLKHSITLSIYNVYNRNNFVMVAYNKIETPKGAYIIPSNLIKENDYIATGLSLPGILPMLTYNIVFNYNFR